MKKYTIITYVFALLSIVTFGFVLAQPVSAQNVAFSINPPLLETFIKPGKTIVVAYTVENRGDPMIVSTDIRPFTPRGIYGDINVKFENEGPIRFSLENSDIKLGEAFNLGQRQGQQLLLKIRVPEGTPNGDYYYTFFIANSLGREQSGFTSTQAQAFVGSNILISVTDDGRIDVSGSIGSFEVSPRFSVTIFGKKYDIFDSTDPVPVKLIVQNTGRNLIKPRGTVIFQGSYGEKLDYTVVPQNVLKESSRMISLSDNSTNDTEDVQNTRIQYSNLEPASTYLKGFFIWILYFRSNSKLRRRHRISNEISYVLCVPDKAQYHSSYSHRRYFYRS